MEEYARDNSETPSLCLYRTKIELSVPTFLETLEEYTTYWLYDRVS
jgi:hypothetical protein